MNTCGAQCGRGRDIEPDFDFAVRRHKMLDAIVRASEMGQRQKVGM